MRRRISMSTMCGGILLIFKEKEEEKYISAERSITINDSMALSSLSHATPLKTHGFSFKYPFDSSPSLIASFSPKPNPTSSCIIPSHNNLLGKIILGSLKWRTGVSFLSGFPTKGEDTNSLKEELYNTIAPLDRGAEATLQDQERVEEIARKLEALNEIKEPLKSSLLNGKWELIYTTSQSVLQTQRPKFLRPNGKIYQAINVDTLRAQNIETWPFFNQVTANLVPLNSRRVAVKFDFFRIASLIPIKNPGSGRGQLEITYLDEELRISRGDRGNLFILKMVDPTYRVPL